MRKNVSFLYVCAVLLAIVPLAAIAQTNYFADSFTNGSTIDSATPVRPTTNSTSYEALSSKGWNPTPSVASHDLKFGVGSTSGGVMEIQALFATNALTLVNAGDYLQLTVVFTDTSGLLLTGAGFLDFGLYNSGQVLPITNGMNSTLTTASNYVGAGWAQSWQGYVGEIGYSGGKSQIRTRPAQTGTDNRNQDVTSDGSSNTSYPNGATVGSTVNSAVTLTAGSTYTETLTIAFNGDGSLAITNALYAGSTTNGTQLASFGGVATNGTYLTGGFDALAVGFYQKTSGQANTLDISSIQVSGTSSPISGPPIITSQPLPVLVATNGSCAFSVSASGVDVTYQWHRHGTNVSTGGNLSVVNSADGSSSMLVVSAAAAADALSGANGYYVTVTGAGSYSTNSVTNSLSLVPATNLTWTAANGNVWDADTTPNWKDNSGNPQVFTCGDAVTIDDTAGGGSLDMTNDFLAAASVTVNSPSGYNYTLEGPGSFAGPGSLLFTGPGRLSINATNTYTGGTLISNANAYLYLQSYAGLGSGSVTLAKAGAQMEIANAGSATVGIAGDISLMDDFTILVDNDGSFGAVFLGALTGTPGKTLSLAAGPNNSQSSSFRIREYGTNFTCAANLFLSNSTVLFAPYQTSGDQTYNGVISGPGGIIHKATGTTYFNAANTYSGGFYLAIGTVGLGTSSTGSAGSPTSGPLGTGPLFLSVDSSSANPSATGTLLGSGGSYVIGNAIQYPSGTNNLTLLVGGTNSLTFSGPVTLNGNDNTTFSNYMVRTIQATNTGGTIISGSISDNSMGYGLVQSGTGTLYLDGANTYTGPTTNSAGMLAGMGSLTSAVYVQTNSSIGGGSAASIGTLTIGSNLTLNGNVFVRVNKSLSQRNDSIAVSGTLNNIGTGTLTVTNLGPTLAAGDRFVVFSAPLVNGGALTVTGAGLSWTNHLALDGSIIAGTVPIATNAPYMTNTLSGNTLTLQWPSDHIGWLLQAQTNSAHGISTNAANWVNVSGANLTNKWIINIDPGKSSVFYRLVYP